MKRALTLLLIPLLLCLLSLGVSAEDRTEVSVKETEDGIREGLLAILPDAAKPLVPSLADTDAMRDALGFRSLFRLFSDTLTEEGGSIGRTALSVIAVTMLFGTLALFAKGSAPLLLMQSAAALSLFSLLFATAERLFSFFTDLSRFTLGLSPLFVTLFAAGGGTAGAAAAGGGFAAFLSLLELFSTTVFPPVLRTLFALALLSSLGNHTLIRELSHRISSLAILLFSILSMLLLASLAFQSILASSADSMAIRTVKYTASASLPFVGSTLASTLGALHASLSLLRGMLGSSAVLALFALFLPPVIELLLLRVSLSLSESIAAFTESAALKEVVARFRSIMDLSLAALITVSLLFLLLIGVFTGLSPFGG